jgi:hypothetical protein
MSKPFSTTKTTMKITFEEVILIRNAVNQAFQAGADQELEACVKLLELSDKNARDFLYSARRPESPSLKEQALTALDAIATGANNAREQYLDFKTIRQALEQLDD